jgi:hypothetical protein
LSAARAGTGVEELLASSSARGRALYRLVRELLDELEECAPWSLLYAPPAGAGELERRLARLLEALERVPGRVEAELAPLAAAAASDEEREAVDEAAFYFSTLHQMTLNDQQRLRAAVARAPAEVPPTRAEADRLCELAADLKGKYTSATMSAAAALVGEGRGLGVAFEARLFPEKAEEAERNRRLLDALTRAARAHRAVIGGFAWRGVLASWRARRAVDRYALGDLVSLRAHLLNLLTVANRRALYSGDYQFLRSRETLLGERLRELEAVHVLSLELGPDTAAGDAAMLFARLEELLLEAAALLDVEVVREELGDAVVQALRAGRAPAAAAGEAQLAGLVPLLAEEDLQRFLELLVGAVRKRASIAHRPLEPAALAPAAPPRRAPPPVRLDARAGREHAARLVAALERLTGAEHPPWKAFQMVHKLQARLGALPPALLRELLPFLAELEADLLPILAAAGVAGAVPPAAVDALRRAGERLRAEDLSRPDAAREIAGDLARIVRLLDSLRAAAEALELAR